ncbi:MAG: hypothetical protein AAF211_01990 [Myxococcota bacterium]
MIGIAWAASAMAAPSVAVIRVPFPTSRVFDEQPDQVCLLVELQASPTSSLSQMSDFDVDCVVKDDWVKVCLTLLEPEWPADVPPVQCGPPGRVLTMRPVKAYDPAEDIWDGVAMLSTVGAYKAVYRVDHPDVPGIMRRGQCGIRDGLFWFETTNDDRKQSCILVMEDDSERVIPIRLVPRLRRLGN